MNRKGQVLVFFIILIPLFLTIAAVAIDMGHSFYQSNKLHSITNMALKYGLKHINDADIRSKIIDLLYKNDNKLDSYELVIEENKITLKTNKTVDSIFGRAINIDFYYLSATYIGFIVNDKIIIEKG
jgi:Flp pilus assembly protein TadG